MSVATSRVQGSTYNESHGRIYNGRSQPYKSVDEANYEADQFTKVLTSNAMTGMAQVGTARQTEWFHTKSARPRGPHQHPFDMTVPQVTALSALEDSGPHPTREIGADFSKSTEFQPSGITDPSRHHHEQSTSRRQSGGQAALGRTSPWESVARTRSEMIGVRYKDIEQHMREIMPKLYAEDQTATNLQIA